MDRRRIITTALAATTLALPATAGAADSDAAKQCLRFDSSDDRAIAYTFTGNVLTLTPREAGEVLRLKASKRRSVKVTKAGDAYTFDVRRIEGETFTVVKRKSSDGKLRFRITAVDADGDRVARFEVRIKAYDTVACKTKEDDDSTDDSKGESKDESGSKGRGRGRESDDERETRKDRDDD